MYLQSLKLFHFRNYDQLEIHFHPQLNIFYGKNGSGKTNLVEAIYVLALTRSFRNVSDKILIQQDFNLSKVEGNVYFPGNNVDNFRILLTKEGKKAKINQTKVTKLSHYITKIPMVLFHPDDLKLIKDTPSTRRKQLNISISQYNLEYLKNLSIYNKLMKQRNSYLKKMSVNANQSYDYLEILTEKLISYGLKIYEERFHFVTEINQLLEKTYEEITGLKKLKVVYHSDYEKMSFEQLKKIYQKMFQKDLAFGKTNLGIHTDDFQFLVDNLDLKEYGSEGQQKNAIIAYKFCEIELLKKFSHQNPIFILDDLFSELDGEKIENIFHILKKDIQTFITTTDVEFQHVIPFKSYKSFYIQNGQVGEEEEK